MLCSLSITFVSCSVLYQLSSFGITEIKQLRIFKCQNTNAQQRSTRIRSIVVIVFAFVTATRSLCHLSGTLARRHFRFPRREEEHRCAAWRCENGLIISSSATSFKHLNQLCPTQMAYWAKTYVTLLTRAAH